MSRKSPLIVAAAALLTSALPASVALADSGRSGKKIRTISVKNDRAETIEVHIDGSLMGILPGGTRAAFPAADGHHRVMLMDEAGNVVLSRRVEVERRERAQVRLKSGPGTVHLVNDSEVEQAVVVVDRSGRVQEEVIEAGDELDLRVTPGEVSVHAAGIWFERKVPLAREQVSVAPGRVETVDLSEVESSLLRVQNVSDEHLEVYLEDERVGLVRPDAVGMFSVPVGHHDFVVKVGDLEVAERSIHVTEHGGGQMVVQADRTELTIANNSSTAALIRVDGMDHGWLASGASQSIEVFAGEREVELLGRQGRTFAEAELTISSARGMRWAPSMDVEDERREARRRKRSQSAGSG